MKRRIYTTLIILLVTILHVNAQKAEQDIQLAHEYYSSGEYEKAIGIYNKYVNKKEYVDGLHKNYVDALYKQKEYKEVGKYLKKTVKLDPMNPTYNVDYGKYLIYHQDSMDADKQLKSFIQNIKKDNGKIRFTAIYLIDQTFYSYAEIAYKTGQQNSNDDFHYELAMLYSTWGKKEMMVDEYMKMLKKDEDRLEFVQISLQEQLSTEEEFIALEPMLMKHVQDNPNNIVISELLMWYYTQIKEFYKAFFQARSIDKRKRMEGRLIMEIGEMALNNDDYGSSIKIFDYVTQKYGNSPVYPVAKRLLIKSKEEQVKHTYPVNLQEIESLVKDYQKMINELGVIPQTADAVRNVALLEAFYLKERDQAVYRLEKLIKTPRIPRKIVSKAKLDLGDIYLLKGEPWESTLLYSQVEKMEKETILGHEAKLRNAKLNYYTGKFELAQAHLDILKLATSREISNDAMALSLLISDNLNLDTAETAMREYARIDLLVFQGQFAEALKDYSQMLKNFSGHSLTDEILWQQSILYIKMGNYQQAVPVLEKILEEHRYDIWADDANFELGKIYEDYIKDKSKAMEYYQQLLVNFKGSSYAVEARKRFRRLRGDGVN